jgi:hypothetical protein
MKYLEGDVYRQGTEDLLDAGNLNSVRHKPGIVGSAR